MKDQGSGWQKPLTAWDVVQRRFFAGQAPDAAAFAQKHGLNEAQVRQVFSGEVTTFSPEMCAALSRETEMSEQFFVNLSNQPNRIAA